MAYPKSYVADATASHGATSEFCAKIAWRKHSARAARRGADQSGWTKRSRGVRNRIATAARGQSILRAHPFISEVERKDHAYGRRQFD